MESFANGAGTRELGWKTIPVPSQRGVKVQSFYVSRDIGVNACKVVTAQFKHERKGATTTD